MVIGPIADIFTILVFYTILIIRAGALRKPCWAFQGEPLSIHPLTYLMTHGYNNHVICLCSASNILIFDLKNMIWLLVRATDTNAVPLDMQINNSVTYLL